MRPGEYRKMFIFEDFYWWYKGGRRILLNQLKRYAPRQRHLNILDAGCGTGKILELLNDYGSVTGIDIADNAVRRARMRNTKARLFQGNVSSLPFADDIFDCIITFDVLYAME